MMIWRNYFAVLPQDDEEQILTSNEIMAWKFINNKSSKNVSEVNGNGGLDLWHTVGYISAKRNAT